MNSPRAIPLLFGLCLLFWLVVLGALAACAPAPSALPHGGPIDPPPGSVAWCARFPDHELCRAPR